MIVKRFGCTAIYNKALYKCIVHSFIICTSDRSIDLSRPADMSVFRAEVIYYSELNTYMYKYIVN